MQQSALLHVVAFSSVLISAVCILLHLAGCLENTRWGLGLISVSRRIRWILCESWSMYGRTAIGLSGASQDRGALLFRRNQLPQLCDS